MALIWVELHEGSWAPVVWCVLQWWPGWSTACLHLGLLALHWVVPVYQPIQWLLIMGMWHPLPHISSVLLMTVIHRREQPILGQSLWLLLAQFFVHEPYLPLLVPAMCEVMVVSLCHLQCRLPVFLNKTRSHAGQVLVSWPETGMVNVMGHSQIHLGLPGNLGHSLG